MSSRPVAIVTGAGSGVGRATAVLLAESGYDVALVARTLSALEATRDLVARAGGSGWPLVADLADAALSRGLVEKTLGHFGRLDAIAHVAGDAPLATIDQHTPEMIERCFNVNILSAINLVSAAWPTFKAQKSGAIVIVSSMASIDPYPGFAAYAPAKAAVNMFVTCVAREGKPFNIRAAAVAPGAIETPMLRSIFDKKAIPEDRTLAPEAVARVVVDCVTGKRETAPGETIPMPSP